MSKIGLLKKAQALRTFLTPLRKRGISYNPPPTHTLVTVPCLSAVPQGKVCKKAVAGL